MTSRIRYRETSESHIIESIQKFRHETNGATYKVRINESTLEYFIIEDMSDTLVTSGRAVNLHQVKMRAKDVLKGLGITFADMEKRERKAKELAQV